MVLTMSGSPCEKLSLSATPSYGNGKDNGSPKLEVNPAVRVYDTSGPYTDPEISVDIRQGVPRLREEWIENRGDTELLDGFSSRYTLDRIRDSKLDSLRFAHLERPRRAKPGRNVSQMHYARQGIVTPEMEYIAIRENLARANREYDSKVQHPGQDFRCKHPAGNNPGIRSIRSGGGSRDHPVQHQPS